VVVLGTRSEIYIRCKEDNDVIELFKHWDGYPEHVIPYLSRFAAWAKRMVKYQLLWLTYPEDVAALLIAYDFVSHRRLWKRFYGNNYSVKANVKPDIRPRGLINDLIRYVYVLDVCEYSKEGVVEDSGMINTILTVIWRLKAFKVKDLGISDNVRKAIKEGVEDSNNEIELVKVKTIKIKGKQSPILTD
jgi:hypothetical protein